MLEQNKAATKKSLEVPSDEAIKRQSVQAGNGPDTAKPTDR